MSRISLISIMLLFAAGNALAANSNSNLADVKAQSDPVSVIESDFRAGKIDLDRKAILQVTAIRNPNALPAEYRVINPAIDKVELRSATPALIDIFQHWKELSPSTQQSLANVMTRWSTAFTYNSPGGFFKMHYDTLGGNAVPTVDANTNGVPDFVEKCAAYCDTSFAKHIALGYRLPPSDGGAGGDGKYDVYFEETVYYGYAQPENPGPEPWNDYTSYLVLNRDFIGFPSNTDPEGNQAGAAKATAAHELHHAIQFAYNVDAELWFMEADATYMEDIVFDQVNDNYNYLGSFFGAPTTGLMDNTSHMYSCFIWGLYLAQRFDTALMTQLWEGARFSNTYTAISDTLQGRFGWSQDSAFAEFTTWNFCTNFHSDGLHHQEASNYPAMTIGRTHTSYPVAIQTPPINPQGCGASYIQFVPNGSNGKLRIIFDGSNTRQWAAYVVKTTGSNNHQIEKLTLTSPEYLDTIDVFNFQSYSSVTLIGINTTENSTAASFTYSAQVLPEFLLQSQMTTDSLVYSGAARNYVVKVKNLAPSTDGVKVVWSDANGWMHRDSVTKSIAPGDSTFVNAPIQPPVGTPLASQSAVTIIARSISDSEIVDTFAFNSTVVLQRGDVSFNGTIDLTDLSTLVAYLTGGGMEPEPVLAAGDFNCAGIVDLADLSTLIAYLIGASGPCPCNPF